MTSIALLVTQVKPPLASTALKIESLLPTMACRALRDQALLTSQTSSPKLSSGSDNTSLLLGEAEGSLQYDTLILVLDPSQ